MKYKIFLCCCTWLFIITSYGYAKNAFFPQRGAIFVGDSIFSTGRSHNKNADIAHKEALLKALVYAEEALTGVHIYARDTLNQTFQMSSDKSVKFLSRIDSVTIKEINEKFPFHYTIVDEKNFDNNVISITIEVSSKQILVAQSMKSRIGLTESGFSGVMCPDTLRYDLCEHVALTLVQSFAKQDIYVNRISDYWLGFKTNTHLNLNDECIIESFGEVIIPENPESCEGTLRVHGYYVLGKGDRIIRKYPLPEVICDIPTGTEFEVANGFPVIYDDSAERQCEQSISQVIEVSAKDFTNKALHN